jgi:nitroreductase
MTPDANADQVTFERQRLARAPLVIAVVSRAAPHVKIPEWEQVLSAGAAAMNLVLAAHALGFAANWITEWYAYDPRVRGALGLAPHEKIAGFVHIGRPTQPPEDRPRPALDDIVTRYGT